MAMALAALFGDRLGGAVLNDVGPVIAPEGIAFIMTYVGKRPPYRTYDEAAAALERIYSRSFTGVSPEVWQRMARVQYDETPDGLDLRYDPKLRDALLAQAEAGPAPDLWPWFEALKGRPVGVIRGANSDLLSPATLAEMQARFPEMIVETVPGRGHVPFLDEPESLRVIRAVMERT
ncbi:alpha/beta fold hydrolase [Seohaeicola zhoushanensis]